MLMVNQLHGFGVLGRTLTFVGADGAESNSTTISWPSGTAAGDIAILLVRSNNTTVAVTFSGASIDFEDVVGSGILRLNGFSKVLTAGDISSPPSYSGGSTGAWYVAVFRGGTGIVYNSGNFAQTGTSITLPGFTPAASTFHIAAIVQDRDASGTITPPTDWVEHDQRTTTFSSWVACSIIRALYPGTDATWNDMTGSNPQNVMAWEIS